MTMLNVIYYLPYAQHYAKDFVIIQSGFSVMATLSCYYYALKRGD